MSSNSLLPQVVLIFAKRINVFQTSNNIITNSQYKFRAKTFNKVDTKFPSKKLDFYGKSIDFFKLYLSDRLQ